MPTGGLLFSDYFLRSGVEDLPEWRSQTANDLNAARVALTAIVDSAVAAASMNESETERLIIEPMLDILGWTYRLTQQNLSPTGRTDVPDYLLFGSQRDFAAAQAEPSQNRRYRRGISFLESKSWQIPLDRAAGGSARTCRCQLWQLPGQAAERSERIAAQLSSSANRPRSARPTTREAVSIDVTESKMNAGQFRS